MSTQASRATREAAGRAVAKVLAARGGSAFRLTSEQRRSIVREAALRARRGTPAG